MEVVHQQKTPHQPPIIMNVALSTGWPGSSHCYILEDIFCIADLYLVEGFLVDEHPMVEDVGSKQHMATTCLTLPSCA